MDYKTRKISREEIRIIARVFRYIFKDCISEDGLYVDAVKIFELVHFKFNNITVEVVEDEVLGNTPGECKPDFNGNYHIQIQESVYAGAITGVGGYRTHILHEISHAFMCMAGFTPICERSFKNKELRACESMEWQAKALTGEIMMDFELTKDLDLLELIDKCGVSYEGAENRLSRKN